MLDGVWKFSAAWFAIPVALSWLHREFALEHSCRRVDYGRRCRAVIPESSIGASCDVVVPLFGSLDQRLGGFPPKLA